MIETVKAVGLDVVIFCCYETRLGGVRGALEVAFSAEAEMMGVADLKPSVSAVSTCT
jgi:hypothetical protein